jgi:phenylpropionate dioxygenase-like ring-hydroxylating dioxygenase large terminal subunit
MEGPDAPIVGKVSVSTYPVQDYAGMIWLWLGSMEPGNLVNDVPEWTGRPGIFSNISMYTDYKCNWRRLVDNRPEDHHALYVHRNAADLIFQP